ncbi:hypothetical protein ACIRPH_21375 [Nocardiopsis sp. NPDC101807]|uniref:hypothetical protein n=1 Tax=Nocardiopsis sp. NPDC101807 TaxID=3364339 RepID=UPI0038102182
MLASHREKTARHLRRPRGPIARDLHGTGGRSPLVVRVPDRRHPLRGVGAGPAGDRVAAADPRGTAYDDRADRASAAGSPLPAVEASAEEVVAGA